MHKTYLGFLLAAVLLACVLQNLGCGAQPGRTEVTDAMAQAAQISVVATSIGGGLAPPASCNPNSGVSNPNATAEGNQVNCLEGWVQSVSAEGKVERHHGCFPTPLPKETGQLLAVRCVTFSDHSEALSANDWVAAKKRLLEANPLSLRTIQCGDGNVVCASDYGSPTLSITLDGNTNSFSWPSDAGGLPNDLQATIDVLRGFAFFF